MDQDKNFEIIKKPGLEYFTVAPGVWGMRIVFVNIYMIATGEKGTNNWVLVDAGLKGFAGRIRKMAEDIFGKDAKPKAIILTHAHFDHTGALKTLLEQWHVPVYAHPLEFPYLKGLSSYPPADPFVGGGMMSWISWIYPRKPLNLGRRVFKLPEDGSVPRLEGWKYIHTPGHAPGHISLFRELDGTLIAGDAFVTTKQESALAVMTQKKEVCGPPKYFTIDWDAAGDSVKALAGLQVQTAATGHGMPMYGKELKHQLHNLAAHFNEQAVPDKGRYVKDHAKWNERGIQYVPKPTLEPCMLTAVAVLGGLLAFAGVWQMKRKHLF